MLSRLIKDKKGFLIHLQNLLKSPDHISYRDINEILSLFPFNFDTGFKNPNFLSTLIFRKRKDLIDPELLAEKLNLDLKTASSIINNPGLYAIFPVSDGTYSELVKALIIPLDTEMVVTPDLIPDIKPLETLKSLTDSGFYITFETIFDYRSYSYMLAIYSVLKFGRKAETIAFTGKLTPSGTIETVSHLEKKKICAKDKGIPLVFPDNCMKSINDLDGFINNLEFPVAILPGTDPSPFLNQFKFSPHYLSEVFHLSESPIISGNLDNSVKSFTHFAEKIDRLSAELSKASEFLPFKVALTSNVLALSFYAGVRFSKYHLPVDYYKFINKEKGYNHYFSIDRDFIQKGSYKPKVIKEDDEIKTVMVISKSAPPEIKNALIIKVPEGKELDHKPLQIASSINSFLRNKDISGSSLCLEVPAGFSFALGYLLEDYKTLNITHYVKGEYKPVLTIGKPSKGNLYLTNAFSLNMLANNDCYIRMRKLSLPEVKEYIFNKGFRSFVSHESTAKILTKLLNTEVEFRREPLTLKDGDELIVFQLKIRLNEGQILGENELKSLINSEKFTFFHVKVYA